jgi:hypothetical protein
MKSENVIQEKSYAFAVRIVKLYKYLVDEKKEYVLSNKQLLRSVTALRKCYFPNYRFIVYHSLIL